MPCPRCGYDLTSVNAPVCPNCGLPLAQQPSYPPAGYPGAPSTPEYSQLPYQPVSEQPPTGTPPSGWPPNYGATPGYGANPTYPGYPPNPTNPGYGAPPSVPLGAPPSTPFGPGQGYPQTYYGQPGMPSQHFAPPPKPKSRTGLFVGIILAIVVIAGASGAAVIALSHGGATSASGTPTTQSTLGPTATATPTVIYQESFATDATGWDSDSKCFYGTGGYHITDATCFAPAGSQTDFNMTVQVQQTSGDTNSPYGLSFRHASKDHRYDFVIVSSGSWAVFLCAGTTCSNLVEYTDSSVIHGGLNTPNTLGILAKGSHFVFTINGTQVGSVDDSTYASGDVGLGSGDGDCVFTNFLVTKPS